MYRELLTNSLLVRITNQRTKRTKDVSQGGNEENEQKSEADDEGRERRMRTEPTADDQIALSQVAPNVDQVILDVTRKANRRARAILDGRAVACADCAATIDRTTLGDTFVLVVTHSQTCPRFSQLRREVQTMPTHRQVDDHTREVIV